MLATEIENQLALAGVCQAATLVQNVARKGELDQLPAEASLSSILVTAPKNPQQVYGSLNNLKLGFQALVAQLHNKPGNKDAELTRYIASILGLERKLARNPQALAQLGERISHVQRQLNHIDFDNQQIIGSLASIYSDVISPLAPRIQVAGQQKFLNQPQNQQRVRALLLAGVRSAVLWRQMGGKRRNILFKRKSIISAAQQALRMIN